MPSDLGSLSSGLKINFPPEECLMVGSLLLAESDSPAHSNLRAQLTHVSVTQLVLSFPLSL